MRTWNDASGAFSLEAKFTGVKDGKVILKKANGKTVAVPLDRLSKEDQVFVAKQTKGQSSATTPTTPVARKARELSHDDGQSAGKSSMAGSAHAVKFKVDGDSYYVTSVSLYGSRYGMPKPPPEKFRVWICNADFQPIATFRFPYSRVHSQQRRVEVVQYPAHQGAEGVHRLLRIQPAGRPRGST